MDLRLRGNVLRLTPWEASCTRVIRGTSCALAWFSWGPMNRHGNRPHSIADPQHLDGRDTQAVKWRPSADGCGVADLPDRPPQLPQDHHVAARRWSRAVVILVLAVSGLTASACSSALIDPSHQDGYYWYKADGVDTIAALQKDGDSLTEACSAQVKHAMPHGDSRGDWVTGCVYAAKRGDQP